MRIPILGLLLLSACSDGVIYDYDYTLSWECRSSEGCERTEELRLIDRISSQGDAFLFLSSRDASFNASAQRVRSDMLPAGCFWLYSVALDGNELEPSKACNTSGGFDLELSIPNRNPIAHSQWLVQARELGSW